MVHGDRPVKVLNGSGVEDEMWEACGYDGYQSGFAWNTAFWASPMTEKGPIVAFKDREATAGKIHRVNLLLPSI